MLTESFVKSQLPHAQLCLNNNEIHNELEFSNALVLASNLVSYFEKNRKKNKHLNMQLLYQSGDN